MPDYPSKNIDFIGDVHADYSKLKKLLSALGYVRKHETYVHPKGRKALFLGDLINVGHNNLKVLNLVQSMCEQGNAFCICGNHEFFLLVLYYSYPGFFTKKAVPATYEMYLPLLKEIQKEKTFEKVIQWLSSIPLAIKTENFSAVHAYWNENNYELLRNASEGNLNAGAIALQYSKNPEIRKAAFETVYGKRMEVPGVTLNNQPVKFRYKWWDVKPGCSYKSIIVNNRHLPVPDYPVPINDIRLLQPTYNNYPVFFGHYWLKTTPFLTHQNFCCLDFGGAKGGKLSSYRFDESANLVDENIIYV